MTSPNDPTQCIFTISHSLYMQLREIAVKAQEFDATIIRDAVAVYALMTHYAKKGDFIMPPKEIIGEHTVTIEVKVMEKSLKAINDFLKRESIDSQDQLINDSLGLYFELLAKAQTGKVFLSASQTVLEIDLGTIAQKIT